MTPLELISELTKSGVTLRLEGGRLLIRRPDPPPPNTDSLLTELKQRREEMVSWLQWRHEAEGLFQVAMKQAKSICTAEALRWAKTERPELFAAIGKAEQDFQAAFVAHDRDGCRKAVQKYVQVFQAVAEAWDSHTLMADEIIKAFRCERVWQLPEDKAAVLDEVFSSPQAVVDAGGSRWYYPDLMKGGHFNYAQLRRPV